MVPETENPPTGAMIDYYLKSAASGPITLEILDANGKSVRTYSSAEGGGGGGRGRGGAAQNVPAYWNRTPETLSAAAGMHRWTWDIHYATTGEAGGGRGGRGGGGGVWAVPGKYSVKLTADGKSYTAPLTVKMDPQVKTPLPELQRQFDFAQQVSAKSAEVAKARGEVTRVRAQIRRCELRSEEIPPCLAALDALDAKAAVIGGVTAPTTPIPVELPRHRLMFRV